MSKTEVIAQPRCPCCTSGMIAIVHRQFTTTVVTKWVIEDDDEYLVDEVAEPNVGEDEFFSYRCMCCGRTLCRSAGELRAHIE